MTRREKDIAIADFTGTKMLSKAEYFPTFYDWKRIMPVAQELVNGYYENFDTDDLIAAGATFSLEEIFEAVVNAIQTIKNNE